MEKIISILGSTGSIGTQSLTVCKKMGYHVKAITAHSNWKLMEEQIRQFNPEKAVLTDMEAAQKLKEAVSDTATTVLSGMDGVLEVASDPQQDTVINALMGVAGLKPTVCAIEAGNNVALANKETLVAGGKLVTELVKKKGVLLTPIDSEHSAIFQCLQGNESKSVKRLIITASGGPFYGKTRSELAGIKKEQALKHPNWSMGAKITIDSASMMNKGFEMIEAKWLFGLAPEQIQVVVHPQSVIHSMVQFEDGAVIAQLGIPDMKLPISYAFSYPKRLHSKAPRLDFTQYATLTFEEPDMERFRNLAFAFDAVRKGGNMPCILNAANEVVVAAFLRDEIGFLQMSDVIEKTMAKATFIPVPTYEDYVATDAEARKIAEKLI